MLKFYINNLDVHEKNYQMEFSIKEGIRILVEECNYDFNIMTDRIMIN